MLKHNEAALPESCWNKAKPSEMVFVLLERDDDAPGTIRDWIKRRIASGKNQPGDAQLENAERIAQYMEDQRNNVKER